MGRSSLSLPLIVPSSSSFSSCSSYGSEIIIKNDRFVGFTHCESNTSAEVCVTLLETLANILDATVNRDTVLFGTSSGLSPLSYQPKQVLSLLGHDMMTQLATTLRTLEVCEHQVETAQDLFSDHHMTLYRKYFPRKLDDQYRRRMREVEASICRVLSEVSKDEMYTHHLLLDREVLRALLPLAVSETRNSTAFVHAVTTVDHIVQSYHKHNKHSSRSSSSSIEGADEEGEGALPRNSLLRKEVVNR